MRKKEKANKRKNVLIIHFTFQIRELWTIEFSIQGANKRLQYLYLLIFLSVHQDKKKIMMALDSLIL